MREPPPLRGIEWGSVGRMNRLTAMLCNVGIHSYETIFHAYADQPFLTGREEDEMCTVEGYTRYECKRCEKEYKESRAVRIAKRILIEVVTTAKVASVILTALIVAIYLLVSLSGE